MLRLHHGDAGQHVQAYLEQFPGQPNYAPQWFLLASRFPFIPANFTFDLDLKWPFLNAWRQM